VPEVIEVGETEVGLQTEQRLGVIILITEQRLGVIILITEQRLGVIILITTPSPFRWHCSL
jgi:hypothetical protein